KGAGKITPAQGFKLAPGETLTVRYSVTYDTAGDKTNKASVKTKVEGSNDDDPAAGDEDETTVRVDPTGAVTLDKAANGTRFPVGASVAYTIDIKNTGDESLTDIVIADDRLAGHAATGLVLTQTAAGGSTPLFAGVNYGFDAGTGEIRMAGDFKLLPGHVLTVRYSVAYGTAGDKRNTAVVTAKGERSDNGVTDRDEVTVNVYTPGGNIPGGGGDTGGGGNTGGGDDNTGGGNDNTGGGGNTGGGDTDTDTDDTDTGGSVPTPAPGNSIIPGGNGVYVEIGEDGIPRGEWHLDEETGEWIFDEYPPLTDLPQTGAAFLAAAASTHLWVFPLLALLLFAFLWARLRRRIGGRVR
ncbi:MAG: hypothetical protein LBE16_06410, partial [Clostridiales Family XIII bacterium]|nr:hypothetical protein [Clostridiales Family XIII bacterium]